MAVINGYLLTEKETKACEELIKKMRENKAFDIDFQGWITVKAKNADEAKNIFWDWVDYIAEKTLYDWDNTIILRSEFEFEGIEEV